MSQLDLALSADVSARHISFLETGRARPSRAMVLRLSDELQLPKAATNQMLDAAGLAPAFRERSMSDEDMAPVRDAVRWMLTRHAPYPALALDRHWTILDWNGPAATLLGAIGVGLGDSLIAMFLENDAARRALENYDELLRHILIRLRTERAHLGGDPVLDAAIAKITGRMDSRHAEGPQPLPAFLPARYRLGDTVLSLFSTISHFGSAEDIALSEMRIELMFPADDTTRATLEALAAT